MSDGLGECGCCEGPLQQRWSMAFHQWWGDQVRGAPNSSAHYLLRVFTYTYHVDFKHGNEVISSWDWVERGSIRHSKWTGKDTVNEIAVVNGLKAPSYLLSTLRYAHEAPTSFAPSFDYPPENYNSTTGPVVNNWYTIQAWWYAAPSMDCFFFAGIPYGPFPGDYRQLGLDTIADSQFSGLGLTTANIGEYRWVITLKTELKYDITDYYSKQAFLSDFAVIKSRVTFADIKAKTGNQGLLGSYQFHYTAFFFDDNGAVIERNYYNKSDFNPAYIWAGGNVVAEFYTERVGSGPVSEILKNEHLKLFATNPNTETPVETPPEHFYSSIDCVLDVGGPSLFISPRTDYRVALGDEGFGFSRVSSYFGAIYLISIYPVPSTEPSFCLSRYASKPDALSNNANADLFGSIRNGASWVDGIETLESHVTFPNPGAANIENQCSGGWTHEILTKSACE